jgi:rhamnosyl/mannosyltransferase
MGHKFSLGFLFWLMVTCFQRKVVHAHDPFPLATLIFCLCRPRALIISYHSDIVRQKALKKITDRLRVHALRRADIVTVTSDSLRRGSDILEHVQGEKVVTLPLFLDDVTWYESPDRSGQLWLQAKDQLLPDKPYALMLGRMNYYKGLDLVCESLQHLRETGLSPAFDLVIAGKNADREAAALSNKLKSFGRFVSRIDRQITDIEKLVLLHHCDFLLFPSTKNTEAFGIVQLEALAVGKPIVNVDLPTGVREVGLHDTTAITISKSDHVHLANLLAGGEDVEMSLRTLAENTRDHLEKNFNKKQIESRLIGLYELLQRKMEMKRK